MGRYREDSGAIAQLIEADRVHRDVYTDPEIFRLEMERLWSRTWIYVGHTSQVPQAGDFITLDIAAQPVIMLRHTAATVRLLSNRAAHNGNWKMFVENLNDTMHPMIAHASSAGVAKKLWEGKPVDMPKPMAIEQIVPFASDYKFFDDMGVRVYAHGHGFSGVNFSIHSSYSSVPEYEAAMKRAYGEERARKILGTVRHNTVYYPSLTIKGAIQSIRVARPLAADKTLLESYTFRLKGAPDALLERTVAYNRLINSPMSVVGHDDLHCYRAIQEGLAGDGHEWVNLHRG